MTKMKGTPPRGIDQLLRKEREKQRRGRSDLAYAEFLDNILPDYSEHDLSGIQEPAIRSYGPTSHDRFPELHAKLLPLKKLCPVIYLMAQEAYKLREIKNRKETTKNAREREINNIFLLAGKQNPPNKLTSFSATLINPLYKYTYKQPNSWPANHYEVPDNSVFTQPYFNTRFRIVLYAACRWHGVTDEEKIEDIFDLSLLLRLLGLRDSHQESTVSFAIRLITGKADLRPTIDPDFTYPDDPQP